MTTNRNDEVFQQMVDILREQHGDSMYDYLLPPPVFLTMEGEMLSFDLNPGSLQTRFPVKTEFLNPYRTLQGGMLAAAIDNTLGPLSMLVAPANVTRRIEITYSRPVTPEMGFFTITANFISRKERKLIFSAAVYDPQDNRLARARAEHWIV